MVGIILGNTKIKNKKSLVNFFDGVTGLMQMLIFFLLGLLATPITASPCFPAGPGHRPVFDTGRKTPGCFCYTGTF